MIHSQAIKTSVSLPRPLLVDLKKVAKEESLSLSAVILNAARNYILLRQWRSVQKELANHARKMGLTSEDSVNDLVHALRK
jgi:metal-responsive CopG/Arc/MetJ family transcriptional regulator